MHILKTTGTKPWTALLAGALITCGLTAQAQAESKLTVGTEGFIDVYRERGLTVDTHTDYRSLTATYEYDKGSYFYAVDGRYSKGYDDYKSDSGVLNHLMDRETDLRARVGMNIVMWHGTMMPYIGGGWRWYFNHQKGRTTSNGAAAYDRHISQFYIPIGATYRFTEGSWTFAPNLEIDPMLLGYVTSHFGFTGLDKDVTNTQRNGYGLRGEFMVGQQYKYFGWQAGPYFRYWHISQSNYVPSPTYPGFLYWSEPNNTRLQYGGAVRVNF